MKKLLLIVVSLFLSSCVVAESSLPSSAPADTLAPTRTATPTPTVEWFPPTSTPTSLPTLTKTPAGENDIQRGDILYQDQFESDRNWFIPATSRENIHVADGEMNLTLKDPKSFVFSVVDGVRFSDFYAEVTASPSLCSGKDEFGMMIRAERTQRYYRYSLSCDGRIRLDRVLGQNAVSLQPWMRSASVPTAAPSELRLGVLAVGAEIRFYIEGVHQFTIQDEAIPQGAIGVFARSGGETAVTVSFSDLVVREVNP